jgi:uncharacterized protein (DUF3820 family)
MSHPTMIQPVTDSTPIPFGKYKGKAMANIPAHYLLWLYNKGCFHEGVRKYIQENLDGLNKEIQNTRR